MWAELITHYHVSNPLQKFPFGTQQFNRYTSDPTNAGPDVLSFPCQNMLISDDGKAGQRGGIRKEFLIGVVGKEPTSFYHKTYDITFFALGTKVFYYDWVSKVTYDTGITLTDGTTSRFDEFFGDVYLSNTTDGIFRIMVARVNGAVANGAATITIDVDGAARLSVFGDTSGDIRIKGVDEAYSSLVVSTGVLTLSGTSSQAYDNNDVAILIDPLGSLEDASKILFWKSRMHLMGFPNVTNVDQPNNSVLAGQFIIGNADEIEKIIDFTFGTGGSTRITVGGGGAMKNILSVGDSIYFFTENKVFSTLSSNVSTVTAALGLTIPLPKDEKHGCLNEDCATVMGNNALTYITNDKRIMRIPIDTESGAAIASPEEDFDKDVRDILKNMDDDQEIPFAFHYNGGRQTIYQVKVNNQWLWLIYDHNIVRAMGSSFVRGAWQPPQIITPMKSLFERNGVLYGATDNTVYSIFTTFSDDLKPIFAIFATGEFNIGNAIVESAELGGLINQPSEIEIKCFVTSQVAGRRSGSAKIIRGSDYQYGSDFSVGSLPVGEGGGGEVTEVAKWDRGFGVFPSQGNTAQIIAENFQDGGYFSIDYFLLKGRQFPKSFSNSL